MGSSLPNILEVFSFHFFFGGFVAGPQFSLRRYQSFISGDIFIDGKTKKNVRDELNPITAGLFRLALGFLFLILNPVLAPMIPKSEMYAANFTTDYNFFERWLYMWLYAKVTLWKYVGVWKFCEASCIFSGLSFNGKHQQTGYVDWDALTNLNIVMWETGTSLKSAIQSFNINTNAWVMNYVFKRLRFLGNKNISQLSALMYLAIWHGFKPGYFIAFFLEFMEVFAENRIRTVLPVLAPKYFADPEWKNCPTVLKFILLLCGFVMRTTGVFFAFAAFDLLTIDTIMVFYSSVYWFVPVLCIVISIVCDILLMIFRKPKREVKKD